mmetsp:Transcript_6116/g.14996  ORF Transcript_6116/g.14996 Transcript_6116/m.14996 type:complete len:226 (-) Transcript_6116:1013-1690(-)
MPPTVNNVVGNVVASSSLDSAFRFACGTSGAVRGLLPSIIRLDDCGPIDDMPLFTFVGGRSFDAFESGDGRALMVRLSSNGDGSTSVSCPGDVSGAAFQAGGSVVCTASPSEDSDSASATSASVSSLPLSGSTGSGASDGGVPPAAAAASPVSTTSGDGSTSTSLSSGAASSPVFFFAPFLPVGSLPESGVSEDAVSDQKATQRTLSADTSSVVVSTSSSFISYS